MKSRTSVEEEVAVCVLVSRVSRLLAPLCAFVLGGMLLGMLAGCGSSATTIRLATYLPITGPDATVGLAMQHAIDLAVKQNSDLGHGYTLATLHFDEASDGPASVAATLVGNTQVMGLLGPNNGASAQAMLPILAQHGLLTMSLGPMPSSLAGASPAASRTKGAEGSASRAVLLRLSPSEDATGKLAVDIAVRGRQDSGLGAHSVYIVDDGSATGKALAAAAVQEVHTRGAAVAGQSTVDVADATSAQAATSAIIDAYPDAIVYSGNLAGAAALRNALWQTGAGSLPVIVMGPGADDPSWATHFSTPQFAENTLGLLAYPSLTNSAKSQTFAQAYTAAYPREPLLPESAVAYDAAMDVITSIKGVVARDQSQGKTVTRAEVLSAVAASTYTGITGTFTFDSAGMLSHPLGWSLYDVDSKGAWKYVTALNG